MQSVTKAVYFIALTIAGAHSTAAESVNVTVLPERAPIVPRLSLPREPYASSTPAVPMQREPAPVLLGTAPESLGDNFGGRSRSHPELMQMAIHAGLGNRDGVEISFGLYRNFGLTRDVLQDFIDRARLHARPSISPMAAPDTNR